MSKLDNLNKELTDLEEKIKEHIRNENVKEFLVVQDQLINKYQEWRKEILNNIGTRFVEKTVEEMLRRAAN